MITVNDKKVKWQKDLTVSQLLKKVKHGNKYAVIRLNGRLISKLNFKNTIIKNNSIVVLLPMIAGG